MARFSLGKKLENILKFIVQGSTLNQYPYTIKVMQEIGYDPSKQHPKYIWKLLKTQYFGISITLYKRPEEEDCPNMPRVSTKIFWNIETLKFLLALRKRNLRSLEKSETRYMKKS